MKKLQKILNEKTSKFTKIDFLFIGIILVGYSILSFINLGSFTNPQTFFKVKNKSSFVLELAKPKNVVLMKLYNGEITGNYSIYSSTDGISYQYITDFNGSGAFAWDKIRVVKKTKYLKITSNNDNDTYIGEIALLNNTGKYISVKNSKYYNNLFDERKMIPKNISYLNSTYFDEIYFARTAYEYSHNLEAYEWVHPPLGKLIQAIPVKLFQMAPFYYRLMGNVAGIVMVLIMYLFGKELFKKRKYALFAALLMAFDTFHFAQTRMGTVDSFLVLFIMVSILFMYKYLLLDKNDSLKKKLIYLFLSGLFIGCAISTKWTGLFAGVVLFILFFYNLFKYRIKNEKRKTTIHILLSCIIFFVILPLAIYISSYLLFPKVQGLSNKNINGILIQTNNMYQYHSTLKATHPFTSSWYTWPICYKPVWYYTNTVNSDMHGTISGIGNIAIWWIGVIAVIYLIGNILYKLIRHKPIKYSELLLIAAIVIMFLPYMFIGRVMFLYHYFPVLPFVMLTIVYMFKELIKKKKFMNYLLIGYLIICLLVFVIYYPVISGNIVSNEYLDALKILSSWYF